MKLLVTGGTGLIGSRFIQTFPQHQYTVLSRSPERAKTRLPNSTKVIGGLSDIDNLDSFGGVINLAGEPIVDKRWTDKQKHIICESRWDITRQLVDKFRLSSNPPAFFVSGSAIGVYSDHGDAIITEQSTSTQADFATSVCERWESIAKEAEPYTRVVLLRTGIVLDAKGGALAKMLPPFKLCLGGRIGDGRQYMSWIHINDMVSAIEFLINNQHCSGPFNMVATEPVPNQQFTKALASALNRIAVLPVPKFALKLLLGESSELLLGSQRVKPDKLLSSGFQFKFPSLNAALGDLFND
ncbi:TIGR01777 family oxidoreductase [Alkalimarinus coralli]|uniref:TIGR01777 family oxidoreductase n=1 Tax=Alkalimarinus coralli TaxID=2935863 RepID=UPI00202B6DD8|nr:TIGR01777 family oxidoreductase [Alkalimarinus coralli]